jgi:hypothetical protein
MARKIPPSSANALASGHHDSGKLLKNDPTATENREADGSIPSLATQKPYLAGGYTRNRQIRKENTSA